MQYSKFQDKQLSRLGFGTMRLPQKEDGSIEEGKVKEMVAYAIDHGVNYFDTAYPYHGGESERFIAVLKDFSSREINNVGTIGSKDTVVFKGVSDFWKIIHNINVSP